MTGRSPARPALRMSGPYRTPVGPGGRAPKGRARSRKPAALRATSATCIRDPRARSPRNCRAPGRLQNGRLVMGIFLSKDDLARTEGAENAAFRSPVPTQIVSNGEYLPPPQSATQKKVEARINELADAERQAPGLEPPAVPAHELRHGGGVPRHERDLRPRFPGRAGRGARARVDAGARARSRRPVHLRRPDPFRARRLRPQGAAGAGGLREPALEPEDEGGGRHLARPLQVPELREGDLLRQRHQPGAAERRAVRRSELVAPVQRADRQGARAHQRLRGLAAPAGAQRHHPQAARLDGGGRQGDRGLQAGFLEVLHDRRSAGALQVPLAARRRAGDVSVLRKGGEGRHQHALHPQGAAAARLREVVRRRVGIRNRVGHRQGRQGLAADELRDLSLGAAAVPRAAGPGVGGVRADRPHPMGHAISRKSRRSSASPMSMPSSARRLPTRRWRIRSSAPRWSAR